MIAASSDLLTQLPLTRACAVLNVPRGSYYRSRAVDAPLPDAPLPDAPLPDAPLPDAPLPDAPPRGAPPRAGAAAAAVDEAVLLARIEELLLECTDYGYPRVTRQLQQEGWRVNHKRIYRLMRAAGLTQPRRARSVRTTRSDHGLPCYPNLLPQCGWRQLVAPDQAWGADLTYVRLQGGFCYLAILLDLFSRRIVGWDLSASLEGEGALRALHQALAARCPAPGWIHHSDRGVQYANRTYVTCLTAAGARISMTGVGAPKENAPTERWMRTVKEAEVDLQDYGTLEEARCSLRRFIEEVYNRKRLHSALGYRTPSAFEEYIAASGPLT